MAGESKLEGKIVTDARRKGWRTIKIMKASIRGWNDRIFFRKGRLLFMEVKDEGQEPSPQQELRHAELEAEGIEWYVVDNYEDARVILGL